MNDYISREAVIKTIRYRVCQGQDNKEHICKRGSCAYCGIMEIMSDISCIPAVDIQSIKPQISIDKYVPLDYNTHTVRITFNWCGAVGHISYVLKGNCKGADILESALDFISDCDMNDIENLVENDCHLAMSGNDDPIFCLHLHKDKNNDVMLSELDAKEVEELIVAVEIVDCKGEIEIEDV